MFGDYLDRWNLVPDGEPLFTRSGRLLPVRANGLPAVLKITILDEERRGARLMAWWNGDGAARVIAHDDDALLMERSQSSSTLAGMARSGRDDAASLIMCAVLDRLHAPRNSSAPPLVPLREWFAALAPAAASHGGIFDLTTAVSAKLLSDQRDIAVLHGDMHHGNVLDFGERGWLAVDPKGLIGEKAFDYVNIFANPDCQTAASPGRLRWQIGVISKAARIEPRRLLEWILAWAGLSAAFSLQDGMPPDAAFQLAEMAHAEIRA